MVDIFIASFQTSFVHLIIYLKSIKPNILLIRFILFGFVLLRYFFVYDRVQNWLGILFQMNFDIAQGWLGCYRVNGTLARRVGYNVSTISIPTERCDSAKPPSPETMMTAQREIEAWLWPPRRPTARPTPGCGHHHQQGQSHSWSKLLCSGGSITEVVRGRFPSLWIVPCHIFFQFPFRLPFHRVTC